MERFGHPIKFKLGNWFFLSKKKAPIILEEKLNPFEKKQSKNFQVISLFSLVLVITTMGLFVAYSSSKFLPETYLEEVRIGGLNKQETLQKISQQYPIPLEHNLIIALNTEEFQIANNLDLDNFEKKDFSVATASTTLSAYYDYEATLTKILKDQQQQPLHWLGKLFFSPYQPKSHSLPIKYDQQKLAEFITIVKNQFNQEPSLPQITLEQSNNPQSLVLNPGENVLGIDVEQTIKELNKFLETNSSLTNIKKQPTLTFKPITHWLSKTLDSSQTTTALKTAQKLVGQELIFTYDKTKEKLTDQDLVSFLTFPSGFIDEKIQKKIDVWKQKLDRPAQNAEFEFDKQTFKVTKFKPHKEGLVLDQAKTVAMIKQTITDLLSQTSETTTTTSITQEFPITASPPDVSLADTNNLGIAERIGFGDSYYAHSIPSRIHNVALTAQKINYSIVPPGKEFSFNKALGEVSALTGYKPAYVIKDGQTVLGDGGGVCQVSTTLFRSLLDAGLNITLRLPHSYRVSYYELDNNPGFDATVYDGNVDLRFINDTNNYVLIYTEADSQNLYMKVELYGTSDGRTTEITNYKSWDFREPLPPVYVPDPSLPTGQTKQIDWAASGIKAQFTHTVKDKNGEIIRQKTYYSNYRPWAAKYLQGV
ncbi:MAG: VanW family protein [Patescibacteria group bacterium]